MNRPTGKLSPVQMVKKAAPGRLGLLREEVRRPDSDQKGPEIFKVIAGALMAVPIAQLMSWWLVNVDPIRLGPAVAKVIPIIVPQQFRGEKLSPKDKNPKRDNKRNGEAESDQEDLDQDGIDPASDVMEVAPGKDDDNRADEPPDQSNDDPSNED